MSDEFETYFQFPLRYVTKAADQDMRNALQNKAVEHATWLWIRQASAHEIILRAANYRKTHLGIPRMDRDCEAWLAGMNALQWSYTSPDVHEAILRSHCRASTEYEAARQQGGWLVRIRRDLLWDMVNHEWPPMKIKVLCAVYAAIGADRKGYKKITHRLLCAMVSGYDGPKAAGEAKLIPESTVRYWLDELHKRGFFRVCMHGNFRFYSIWSFLRSDNELAKWVKSHETKKRPKKRVVKTSELQESQQPLDG